VIVEPVQGEGGYVAPGSQFLRLVRQACDKAGALLIADEVQAGAGRTGRMWSIEHSGVRPDLLAFGKGMGGDLPMAGVAMRADLAQHIPPGSQPGTFAANALSAAVCLTNIALLTDPALALIERAHQVGLEAMERLRAAECSLIGEVRGRGLMIGIELVEDRAVKTPLAPERVGKIVMECLGRGIIMVPCGRNGNVLRLMPSLTIPRSYLFGALERLIGILGEAQA
jgi:4-aminobutyrate aminotransferase